MTVTEIALLRLVLIIQLLLLLLLLMLSLLCALLAGGCCAHAFVPLLSTSMPVSDALVVYSDSWRESDQTWVADSRTKSNESCSTSEGCSFRRAMRF